MNAYPEVEVEAVVCTTYRHSRAAPVIPKKCQQAANLHQSSVPPAAAREDCFTLFKQAYPEGFEELQSHIACI